MKRKDGFTYWSIAFFFGWILAFPYYGAVLNVVAQSVKSNGDYLVYTFLISHALSYLTGALVLKKQSSWKRLMLGSLIGMIIINLGLWFSPSALWPPGMFLLGFVSSFYVLGWSYLFSSYHPLARLEIIARMIIRASLITISIIYLSSILSSVSLLMVTLAPLIAALVLMMSMRPEISVKLASLPKTKKAFPGVFILILCLFITGLYLNTGFMFSVVHSSYPIMVEYKIFHIYYRYIPYLLTFFIILQYSEKIQKHYLVTIGVSLLGLAFVFFALLENSISGFFLTVTVIETAFALINLFVWTLLGDLACIYGFPHRFFGFGLFGNIAGTSIGGLTGSYLFRQGDSPQLFIALFAIATIFLTIIILPWLKEKVESEITGISHKINISLHLPSTDLLKQLSREAGLTTREKEIVELLLQGLTNRTIAGRLFISENTLKTHLRNVYRKFNVSKKREFLAQVAGRINSPPHSTQESGTGSQEPEQKNRNI